MSIDNIEGIKKTLREIREIGRDVQVHRPPRDVVPLTRQEMADEHVMRHLNDANKETHGLDWLCAWHERRQRQARYVVKMWQP